MAESVPVPSGSGELAPLGPAPEGEDNRLEHDTTAGGACGSEGRGAPSLKKQAMHQVGRERVIENGQGSNGGHVSTKRDVQ